MASVVVRDCCALFAASVKVSVPVPEKLMADFPPIVRLVIHDAVFWTPQTQPPLFVVTVIWFGPPAGPTLIAIGEMVYVQSTLDCETLNLLPLIVMVPERGAPVLFTATVKESTLLPDPELALMVIQPESLDAVQPHGLVMVMLKLPPAG